MESIKKTKIILLAISFSVATLFADTESDFIESAGISDAYEKVKKYLEEGLDPNAQHGMALARAITNHNIDTVRLLLDYGADPNIRIHDSWQTALFYTVFGAKRADNSEIIKSSVNFDESEISIGEYELTGRRGHTSISTYTAILLGNRMNKAWDAIECVKLLLQRGADASANDSQALISHTGYGKNPKIVKILIEAGAKANARDSQALINAASDADAECVKILLQNGAEAKAQDSEALIEATSYPCYNNIEIVRLLLEYGADPKAQDSQALINAVKEHKTEIVKLLVKEGADPKAQEDKAILEAIENGYADIVEFFIEIGVATSDALQLALSKESTNRGLRKACICTTMYGDDQILRYDLETIKQFFREGAELDEALIWSIMKVARPAKVVELLLEGGADPTAHDSLALKEAIAMPMANEQAFPWLKNKGREIIIKMLQEAIAKKASSKEAN